MASTYISYSGHTGWCLWVCLFDYEIVHVSFVVEDASRLQRGKRSCYTRKQILDIASRRNDVCRYASVYGNKELLPSQSSFIQDSSPSWYVHIGYGHVHAISMPEVSKNIHCKDSIVSQLPSLFVSVFTTIDFLLSPIFLFPGLGVYFIVGYYSLFGFNSFPYCRTFLLILSSNNSICSNLTLLNKTNMIMSVIIFSLIGQHRAREQ